jgi:hypothetical protein
MNGSEADLPRNRPRLASERPVPGPGLDRVPVSGRGAAEVLMRDCERAASTRRDAPSGVRGHARIGLE